MSEVSNYKGVKIQVNHKGVFYADPLNNSVDFDKALLKSEKILSIEKAIDEFTNTADCDTYFYEINAY